MPDYSIVKPLCHELGITVAELIDGEEKENKNIRVADERQIIDILERIQRLEKQKQTLFGMMLIIMGIAMMALSQFFYGTNFRDFVSGLILGVSIGEMLVGVYIIGRTFSRQ